MSYPLGPEGEVDPILFISMIIGKNQGPNISLFCTKRPKNFHKLTDKSIKQA